jgi:serine/threonine-protein kinase RsbW
MDIDVDASMAANEEAVELEIPARPEYVALARLVVTSFASLSFEFDDQRIDDLKIAVSEACTNAIEAHGAADTDERVLVRCVEADGNLEVLIEDQGHGFDINTLADQPLLPELTRLSDERGLGIPLIRTLVDEVEFRSSDRGTAVRLIVKPSLTADGI